MQIYVQVKLPISIHSILNIYVYLDIVKLSPVSNSQVAIIGFFPIKSNFQEKGHWVFNPLMYVKVRQTYQNDYNENFHRNW